MLKHLLARLVLCFSTSDCFLIFFSFLLSPHPSIKLSEASLIGGDEQGSVNLSQARLRGPDPELLNHTFHFFSVLENQW